MYMHVYTCIYAHAYIQLYYMYIYAYTHICMYAHICMCIYSLFIFFSFSFFLFRLFCRFLRFSRARARMLSPPPPLSLSPFLCSSLLPSFLLSLAVSRALSFSLYLTTFHLFWPHGQLNCWIRSKGNLSNFFNEINMGNTAKSDVFLGQHPASHCNTLQQSCNTPHLTAPHCNRADTRTVGILGETL